MLAKRGSNEQTLKSSSISRRICSVNLISIIFLFEKNTFKLSRELLYTTVPLLMIVTLSQRFSISSISCVVKMKVVFLSLFNCFIRFLILSFASISRPIVGSSRNIRYKFHNSRCCNNCILCN